MSTTITMSTHGAQRPTAQIYQFPRRKRAQAGESSEAAQIRSALAMPRAAAAALGSAWYHEEAMEQDEHRLGA